VKGVSFLMELKEPKVMWPVVVEGGRATGGAVGLGV
jgi:hypothetical protein